MVKQDAPTEIISSEFSVAKTARSTKGIDCNVVKYECCA